tara:strand:+ start:1221 stop:1790 length:570 start_codon:yes stop_codon:yes gene_type:complete
MIASTVGSVSTGLAYSFKAQDMLLVCGVMLLVSWALMRLRSKTRNRKPLARPQEIIERNRQVRGMQGQLEELMVEVEALTRRFGVQLDAKARRLENLLAQADDRIEQLRELQGQPSLHQGEVDDEQNAASGNASVQQERTPPPAPIEEDPLAKSVYQLADSGMDAHAIAMQLNEHVGKVELILALRKAK